MRLLSTPRVSPPDKCPYLKDQQESHEFFFADQIKSSEIDFLLSKGWRKFGQFFFRPRCSHCNKCTPLRVSVQNYGNSKSMRRVEKQNDDILVKFSRLEYRPEHFKLYIKHSKDRFNEKQIDKESEFIQTFYLITGTEYMSEFYLDGELVAFGILDKGIDSLSSVYFVFDPEHSKRGLGNFGVIKEIEYAKEKGLKYYYLGYWIEENKSMQYKKKYYPHELYDWQDKLWELSTKKFNGDE